MTSLDFGALDRVFSLGSNFSPNLVLLFLAETMEAWRKKGRRIVSTLRGGQLRGDLDIPSVTLTLNYSNPFSKWPS